MCVLKLYRAYYIYPFCLYEQYPISNLIETLSHTRICWLPPSVDSHRICNQTLSFVCIANSERQLLEPYDSKDDSEQHFFSKFRKILSKIHRTQSEIYHIYYLKLTKAVLNKCVQLNINSSLVKA